MRIKLILALLLIFTANAFAQSESVSGIVYDSGTNETLVGATVKVKGTTKATMTNNYDGWYLFASGNDPSIPVIGYVNTDGSISIEQWGLWYNFGTEAVPDWSWYLYGTCELTKSSAKSVIRKTTSPQGRSIAKKTRKSLPKAASHKQPRKIHSQKK